jgi:hypothetical protein
MTHFYYMCIRDTPKIGTWLSEFIYCTLFTKHSVLIQTLISKHSKI